MLPTFIYLLIFYCSLLFFVCKISQTKLIKFQLEFINTLISSDVILQQCQQSLSKYSDIQCQEVKWNNECNWLTYIFKQKIFDTYDATVWIFRQQLCSVYWQRCYFLWQCVRKRNVFCVNDTSYDLFYYVSTNLKVYVLWDIIKYLHKLIFLYNAWMLRNTYFSLKFINTH